jgi:hypothetical protein
LTEVSALDLYQRQLLRLECGRHMPAPFRKPKALGLTIPKSLLRADEVVQ